MTKWDKRFLDLAKHISQWSKDPSTKCGAVITNDKNHLVSVGFNGFPPGVWDNDEWLNDRDMKLKIVRHAEANAIYYASLSRLYSQTIYVYPIPPCTQCASAIIQAGIRRVVCPVGSMNSKWSEDWAIAQTLYSQTNIELCMVEDYD